MLIREKWGYEDCRRRRICGYAALEPAPGEGGDMAVATNKVDWRERDGRDRRDKGDRIKPNQTKSNQIKPKREGRGWVCSGQWTVVSGRWRVAKEDGGKQPGQTQSNSVKPVRLRFEQKHDYPKRDAYVIAVAEIALGQANQTKSNQIKPARRQKDQNSKVQISNSVVKTPQYAVKEKQE